MIELDATDKNLLLNTVYKIKMLQHGLRIIDNKDIDILSEEDFIRYDVMNAELEELKRDLEIYQIYLTKEQFKNVLDYQKNKLNNLYSRIKAYMGSENYNERNYEYYEKEYAKNDLRLGLFQNWFQESKWDN